MDLDGCGGCCGCGGCEDVVVVLVVGLPVSKVVGSMCHCVVVDVGLWIM